MVSVVTLRRPGKVYACKRYTGAAAGDLVKVDAKVAAVTDRALGFLVDDIPTDNPMAMLDAYGDGSVIEFPTSMLAAAAPGTPIYSDGDGTISSVQPAGTCYRVGHILGDEDGGNSSVLDVMIERVEAEV